MWSIIAAVAYPNRVIGSEGRLPWHLPLELRLFREKTWGGVLVMGRHTWETLGRPLPGREIWVIGKNVSPSSSTRTFSEMESLLRALRQESRPVFFAGGGKLYQWAIKLPEVQKLLLSWIFLSVEGNITFPELDGREWRPLSWELLYDRCVPIITVEYQRVSAGG
ncbi:MAG: dihydrofolate reductase [Bacteroidia bacterium]|nr:dihydrofolate reductase [Bacteroidia bacterium]